MVLELSWHSRLPWGIVDGHRMFATQIDDDHPLALLSDHGVIAGYQSVVQDEVLVPATTDGVVRPGQLIAAADLRSALHDQEDSHGIDSHLAFAACRTASRSVIVRRLVRRSGRVGAEL